MPGVEPMLAFPRTCAVALALATLATLVLGLAMFASPAQAQTHQCGDMRLVFVNPDLQPQADGFIHAQGQFFAQFQAIGAQADQIAVFGFSFGPDTVDFSETACDAPLWATGTYIYNYRADRDASDGFFIPVKTTLVPDGTYAAAVHAYDAGNNELARFWGRAIVDNCDAQPTPAQERCQESPDQLVAHDRTAPWPMVLPGDGQALEGKTLTIEFGEALANLTVYLNGQDITAQLQPWEGRLWDSDLFPDYGPGGLSAILAPPCSQPYHTCEHYGPAYEWTGRPLTAADVVRIEATDLAGNRATKDIHIGSSVAGGAVTGDVPILSYTVDAVEVAAAPGETAIFRFRIQNNGAGEGHPFAEATVPPGWAHTWSPPHVVVPPGGVREQELAVEVPAGAAPGRNSVDARLVYKSAGEDKVLAQALAVMVGAGNAGPATNATTTDASEASPLPLPLALGALGVALARGRRDILQ